MNKLQKAIYTGIAALVLGSSQGCATTKGAQTFKESFTHGTFIDAPHMLYDGTGYQNVTHKSDDFKVIATLSKNDPQNKYGNFDKVCMEVQGESQPSLVTCVQEEQGRLTVGFLADVIAAIDECKALDLSSPEYGSCMAKKRAAMKAAYDF